MSIASVVQFPTGSAVQKKKCADCDRLLPLSEFPVRKSGTANVKLLPRPHCRTCRAKIHKIGHAKYRAKTPAWHEYGRANDAQRKFGVSPDQYAQMLARQNGACGICKRSPKSDIPTKYGYTVVERFAIDHDHSKSPRDASGHRGLLCITCNSGLGMLQDSVAVLRNAAEYLERYALSKSDRTE